LPRDQHHQLREASVLGCGGTEAERDGRTEQLSTYVFDFFSRIHPERCINHIKESLDSRYIARKDTTHDAIFE
jgi:hypothetical protein